MLYTPILLSEAFPVAATPARSTDCISWSRHNVLVLATRDSVHFYTANLRAAAGAVHARHHPLCYRGDEESPDWVVGAKWCPELLSVVRYPAEARVCVRTAGNLIVYRVARRGVEGEIAVTKGVGIGANFHPDDIMAAQKALQLSSLDLGNGLGAMDDPDDDDEEKGTGADAGTTTTKATEAQGRNTTAQAKPAQKKVGRKQATSSRRGNSGLSDESDDDDDDGETSSSSSSSLSDAPPRKRAKASAIKSKLVTNKPHVATEAPLRTTQPVESPLSPLVPDGGRVRHILIDYFWLPDDTLAVITTAGIHLVLFAGDFSDSESPQVRQLPPPSHSFKNDVAGIECPPPCCAALVSVDSRITASSSGQAIVWLLVASPFLLRVFSLSDGAVRLVHYMDVPSLSCIPSCVCAILEPAQAASGKGGVGRQLTVILSSPNGTERVQIVVPQPTGGAAAAALPAPPTALPWEPLASHGGSRLTDDPFLRGFSIFPAAGIMPADRDPRSSEFIVVAVGQRCLQGFTHNGKRTVTLFRCPLIATATEVPADAAVSVCGVALHPSCGLGVMAVQTAVVLHDPIHLLPIAANDPEGFLHRMLSLNCIAASEDETAEVGGPSAPDNARFGDLWAIWRRQQSADFFVWQQLFPASKNQVSMRSYAEAWAQYSRRPTDDGPAEGAALRQAYRDAQSKHGVSLFLRVPAPDNWEVSPPPTPGGDAEAPWWHLLLRLWRCCPWDATSLAELALASAVTVIAKRASFAGLSLSPEESFWEDGPADAPSSSSPWVYSYTGALAYAEQYVVAQEKTLRAAEAGGPALAALPSDGFAADGGVADSGPELAPWCCSQEWVDSITGLLAACKMNAAGPRGSARTFPCSVCDAPQAARLCARTFCCSSLHVSPSSSSPAPNEETHTTLFSPKTFCPLSLFSDEAVLTRCVGCGVCDFATGPCCRLCGGLIQ